MLGKRPTGRKQVGQNATVGCKLAGFHPKEHKDVPRRIPTNSDGISYLVDNAIFIRYLEINGQLRKAVGVLKKRLSDFEKTLREIEITSQGVQVGKPLTGLRGILLGTPEWVQSPEEEGCRNT